MSFDWEKIRNLYPAAKKYVYLNAAGGPPISKPVSEAGKRFYEQCYEVGDTLWDDWIYEVEDVRKLTADFLNADAKNLAFISSTSEGINIVAKILKGKGDVITFSDEFPAETLPWLHHEYKVTFVDSREDKCIYLEDIEKALTPATKIFCFSTVQSPTGFRFDFDEIYDFCKRNGLIIVVDMTQCTTVFPVDLSKYDIDFLVFSAYKWTMAGYGLAVLYLNDRYLDPKNLPAAGWNSMKEKGWENKKLDYLEGAAVLEVGCPSLAPIFALGASLEMLMEIGVGNIRKRLTYLSDYLVEKLKDTGMKVISSRNEKHKSPILLLDTGEKTKELARLLFEKYSIFVAAKPVGMRVSLNIYNNEEDVDKFVAALKEIKLSNLFFRAE